MNYLHLLYLLFVLSDFVRTEPAQDLHYVFKSGTHGYECFRIPAVVNTGKRLIAFAEGRVEGCGDAGNIDIVVRISEDNGKSWGPLRVIQDDQRNTCGNPAPVYDTATGRIHLLTTWNRGDDHEPEIIAGTSEDTRRVFYSYSEDGGDSWSVRREITKDVKMEDWSWYATGPGSGIILQEAPYKGRIMVACDHIEAETRKYYSHVIYSDDRGMTWQLGGSTPQDQVNECEVVELPGGDLLLNMRNYDRSQKTRRMAKSTDGGATWSDIWSATRLIEPICQASFHRTGVTTEGNAILAFSNPSSTEERRNMTVKFSYDNGETWPYAIPLHSGPSAYSDLVNIDGNYLGCLFEGGQHSPYEGIAWKYVPVKNQ